MLLYYISNEKEKLTQDLWNTELLRVKKLVDLNIISTSNIYVLQVIYQVFQEQNNVKKEYLKADYKNVYWRTSAAGS